MKEAETYDIIKNVLYNITNEKYERHVISRMLKDKTKLYKILEEYNINYYTFVNMCEEYYYNKNDIESI